MFNLLTRRPNPNLFLKNSKFPVFYFLRTNAKRHISSSPFLLYKMPGNNKCPVCGKFFIFNEKKVSSESGITVHEKCLSGVKSLSIDNMPALSEPKLEQLSVKTTVLPTQSQEKGTNESSSIASDVTKVDPSLENLLDKLKEIEDSAAIVEVLPTDCPLLTPATVAEATAENELIEFALLQQIASRLSVIEAKLSMSTPAPGNDPTESDQPSSIKDFDTYCLSFLDPFVAACAALGGDANDIGTVVKKAWYALRGFLLLAANCKEPTDNRVLQNLLKPMAEAMKEASMLIKRNEWEKHAKTCAEGIQCLNWVCVKPAPRDFIESYVGGSDYWSNNIRKEFRLTSPQQIAFCDGFKNLLLELMVYVKAHHTTGVTWNSTKKGLETTEFNSSSTSSTSSITTAVAPVTMPAAATATAAPGKPAPKADLFSALNKGGAITSGLKTVTKDMQTWRAEYKGGDAPVPAPAATKKAVAPRVQETVKGPPKLEFQQDSYKWLVEFQSGPAEVNIGDKRETVYIFGCVGATVTVNGKCKSINVDSCKKTKVIFDMAMASCEIVNSQRINVQVRKNGAVPAVAIDKTDGIVVALPASSLTTEIVASKSSEMNVQWIDQKTGDLVERPIPEQYVHHIDPLSLSVSANVSDLYS